MIAVDSSALLAIVLREPAALSCKAALQDEPKVVISAGTLAETLVVASRRNIDAEVMRLVDELDFDVVPVTQATAQRIAQAHVKWGKGMNPAGLNFGDCFAYDVAKQYDCPLLYVGDDFAKTDVESVL